MIRYKLDVMAALKSAGYNTSVIRKQKIMGQQMLQKIKGGCMPSWSVLDTICQLTGLQPGDIIEYVDDNNVQGGSV